MSERLTEAHPGSREYLPGSLICPLELSAKGVSTTSGIGGYVSEDPSHFMVHELSKCHPSGEGEHSMALILKCDRTTEEAVSAIAEATGVSSAEIGYAGRKDKKALTTQWMSFPCVAESLKSNDPQVLIVCASAHRQKLRLGYNAGNLFTILISEIDELSSVADEVARIQRGIPNYFGQQRFGNAWYERRPEPGYIPPVDADGTPVQDPSNRARDNVDRALRFLDKFDDPRTFRRLKGQQKREVKLSLSALQSALFNLWVGERIRDGLADQVIAGDVCRKIEGGTFYSSEPEVDTERLRRGEIMVLGPMVGPKLFPAQAAAKLREEKLYEEWGLTEARRSGLAKAWRGDRRSMLLSPLHLTAFPQRRETGELDLRLSFTLPSGSFATAVLGSLIDPHQKVFTRRPVG